MMTTKKLPEITALLLGGLLMFLQTPAIAAEFCADEYYIETTFPNQASWDMCWEHRSREGIVLHKVHFTPQDGTRRMILNEAAIAQIHVPYDDNGARYHDVTDYGLGDNYMVSLPSEDCPDGTLLNFDSKPVICQQVEHNDDAYSYGSEGLQGYALNLFSVSKIGAYNYIPTWRFLDDGSIEPAVGATGALQRYGTSSADDNGWLVSANKIGIAHLHNFFWRLDFDLAGSSNNDYVEELNFNQSGGYINREATRYVQETASNVDPYTLRRWRVADGAVTGENGEPISYDIRLHQSSHKDRGPDSEPFTHNDLYVTRYNSCELFASHNPTTDGCSNNLASFIDDENLVGEDIVIWPSTTFYHMPRAEDAPYMDIHWSSISITPRDWLGGDTSSTPIEPEDTTDTDEQGTDDTDTSDSTDSTDRISSGGGGSIPGELLLLIVIFGIRTYLRLSLRCDSAP